MAGGPPQGGPIASALSRVLADTIVKTTAAGAPAAAAHRETWVVQFMERLESEGSGLLSRVIGDFADHPEVPPNVAEAFRQATDPEHPIQLLAIIIPALLFLVKGAMEAMIAPEVQQIAALAWRHHPTVPLSPSEAALALVRGVIDPDYAAAEAANGGVDGNRFGHLVDITGEPPGIQELLFLYRRGRIDRNRLERGIRQSRVRNEWIDAVEALQYQPLTPSEAVAAAVEGHLDEDTARAKWAEGGMEPGDFDVALASAGSPPGIQEMLDLWNRGDVTRDEVVQAIRESHYKNKYVPAILARARHLPPERTVVSMVRQGVLTAPAGIEHLQLLGFSHDDAANLIAEATAAKHEKNRDLAVSQITQLYEEQAITEAKAHELIKPLGYDDDEVGFILALADNRRLIAARNTAIGRVHSQYVARHIDRGIAGTDLDSLHVPSDQRDDLLATWDIEREATVHVLTQAQLAAATRAGLLDRAGYVGRLVALGYSQADATMLGDILLGPA